MRQSRRTLGALVASAVAVLLPVRAAHAQDSTWELKIVAPKPATPPPGEGDKDKDKDKDKPPPAADAPLETPPILRAILNGRPGLVQKDFILKQSDAQPPLVIESTKSVVYRESDEPMAMVILVQGNFRWMGNETFTDPSDPEAGSVYDGAYKGLGPAIDELAKAGPQGSKAALLVYAEGKVQVKQAMGDAASLSASALGSQQDYGEFISKPIVLGLAEAWKMLIGYPDHRKVLVVFGDGTGDKEDIAAELKKALADLKTSGVEVYSIFYTASPDDGPQGQQNMAKIGYTENLTATSRDNFSSLADNLSETIGAKYYVDFSGDKVAWDGLEHEFTLSVANEEREPKLVTVPLVKKKKVESGSMWWVWLLVILALIVLIIVVVVVIKRRQPVYEEPPPMEAPVAAAPMRTIMLGVGGGEDSLPIVGWVVPMGGPNQFQTFKLSQGATKLGTGGASLVVVTDSFMSTEHAEIVCSASGFVLNDLGSTNGTYVNSRRVSSHELVDNDVFKLGKTDFKFKSIN
jgi:hypothetical protein